MNCQNNSETYMILKRQFFELEVLRFFKATYFI
nr:MAG TPA: hypothetical protein [Caudoviricetes sp.]